MRSHLWCPNDPRGQGIDDDDDDDPVAQSTEQYNPTLFVFQKKVSATSQEIHVCAASGELERRSTYPVATVRPGRGCYLSNAHADRYGRPSEKANVYRELS